MMMSLGFFVFSLHTAAYQEQLADALTAQVETRIHRSTKRGEQGEVATAFGSLDELNGLLDKLGVTER